MGALFLSRTAPPANVRDQFARHGLAPATALVLPGWHLDHHGYAMGGPETLLVRGDDFAAVAGTLVYDGKMGQAGLAALLDTLDPLAPDWSRIGGEFALVLRRAGRAFLLGDYFGTFQTFHDRERSFFSTSFLAAAKAPPRLHFDAQGVYEWAFNVVPIGNDTIFTELSTLGPNTAVELVQAGTFLHPLDKTLPPATLGDPVQVMAAALGDIVAPHAAHFGDAIFCPLSGGLDSRLLLATLRAAGSKPHLYVYGPPWSEDVAIARAIGAAEGLAVEWIDKDAHEHVAPDAFPDLVAANFHQFDAMPTYGNIFDNGGHAAAQRSRHAGGALAASGGAGEVFRNFFFLPDRPISARTIASTFFARFDPRDVTERFDARTFLRAVESKIAEGVGVSDAAAPMPRLLAEQAYPRVRCRALFGREISLEARLGPYLMPFLDHRLAAEAMALPIGQKNAGRFEARLLHAIDPALARHPSAYGHDFAGPPGRRHRFDEWLTRIRPPWLRRTSYALRRRLSGPFGDEHGGLLTPDYMGRVIDLDFPVMRRFFRMERIADRGMWRRIACLEYLAGQLGDRLAD